MEKKIKISKNHIFQGTVGISALIIAFSIFNVTEITQTSNSIDMLEIRVEREKRAIREAEAEIKEIEEEFMEADVSHPLDIDGRVPLIVRDIQRLISRHNIESTISQGGSSRNRTATASLDSITGLSTISFNVSLEYFRYSDVENMLISLRDSFPVTIDNLTFSGNSATFNFTIYGN